MQLLKEILLFVSLGLVAAFPVEKFRRSDSNGGTTLDNIIIINSITGMDELSLNERDEFVKRGVARSPKYRWGPSTEGGKTIIEIPMDTEDLPRDEKAKSELDRAIKDLHVTTCVRFIPQTNEKDYVKFKEGASCRSKIGKQGGEQVVDLGAGCEYKGTILHELVHVLGFYHEHNRADRDDYLTIYEENIDPKFKKSVMKKYGSDRNDNLRFAYDLHSIMQYGKHAFAKSKNLVTMEAKSNKNMELGNRDAMSADDIMKINRLFGCAERNNVYRNMEVTIQTGDGYFDGTDGFVYLEIFGDKGERGSGESSVGKGGYQDDFESGQTDHFLVAFKDVGTIRRLKVKLQENPDGGYFQGWTFDGITIKDGASTYTFGGGDLSPDESLQLNPK